MARVAALGLTVMVVGCALPAPWDEVELPPAQVVATLEGGIVTTLGRDAQSGTLLAGTARGCFGRDAPGHWSPRPCKPVDPLPPSTPLRLPNGESLAETFRSDPQGGRLALRARTDLIEWPAGARQPLPPVRLPGSAPRAVAADPVDGRRLLVAGATGGLFECTVADGGPPQPCGRLLDRQVTAAARFSDGSALIGDVDGRVLRRRPSETTFSDVARAPGPVAAVTGVPDGGPRFIAYTEGTSAVASPSWLVSTDHGASFQASHGPVGAVGSGGLVAALDGDGRLTVRELDGSIRELVPAGNLPPGAPVRWSSSEHVVVGLRDGFVVAARNAGSVRRFVSDNGSPRTFLDAGHVGSTLLIYTSGGPAGVELQVTRVPAGGSPRWGRLAWLSRGSVMVVGLVALVLGAVYWWIDRRLKRIAREVRLPPS